MDPITFDSNSSSVSDLNNSSNNDKKIGDVDVDEYIRKINQKRLEKRRTIIESKKTAVKEKPRNTISKDDNKDTSTKDINVQHNTTTTSSNIKQNPLLLKSNTVNHTNSIHDQSIANNKDTKQNISVSQSIGINEVSIEEKLEYISLKKKLAEKDHALAQVKDELKSLEIESRRLQMTVDVETNKKFLKEKQEAEKIMLMKSIEMDNDSDDIQKSLTDHIDTLKKEYNESLEELSITSEQLKKSQDNIEELNVKYSLMKKTLLKTMDQYETLKDSFDDDGEVNEKNTLFCTFDNLMPPIPFVYNK